MRSSTSSSRAVSFAAIAAQLATFAAGGLLAFSLVWGLSGTGLFDAIGIDPDVAEKWRPRTARIRYAAYTRPGVPTGGDFRRRAGRRRESGRVLAAGAEARGIFQHPYADAPPVHVHFGRYGFRDEYPAVPGGTAVVGASYVEAAFANAEDTIPGWLRRDHGIAAANFGLAFSGGYTSLHVLERYVLPTQPAEVIWVFAGRGAYDRLLAEHTAMNAPAEPVAPRPPFLASLVGNARGYWRGALLRARSRLHGWFPSVVDRLPEELARLQPVLASPHATIDVAGKAVPVDVSLFWKPDYARSAPALIADVLTRMKAATSAREVGLRVVYLPSRQELFDGRWIEPPKRTREVPDQFALLKRAGDTLGVPVIDATPALRERLDAGVLVVNPIHDQHLNSEGMRVISRLIAESRPESRD